MKALLTLGVLLLGVSVAVAADPVIAKGKLVKVDYTLSVDEEQVETSVGKQPLEFAVGGNTIIPGLESQLMGMHEGEEKIVFVEAKDAYGEIDTKAVKEFPKASMPKGVEPKSGMVLQAQAPDGEEFPAMVKEVKDDKVVLDFNHPLAGKKLKFQIKVLSIVDAPAKPAAAAAPALAPSAPAAK